MAEAESAVRNKLIQTRPMPVTVGILSSIVASAATAKAPVKVQADKAARQFLSICDLFEGNRGGF